MPIGVAILKPIHKNVVKASILVPSRHGIKRMHHRQLVTNHIRIVRISLPQATITAVNRTKPLTAFIGLQFKMIKPQPRRRRGKSNRITIRTLRHRQRLRLIPLTIRSNHQRRLRYNTISLSRKMHQRPLPNSPKRPPLGK